MVEINTCTPLSGVQSGLLRAMPQATNATWAPLSGGRTNQSWRVAMPDGHGTLVVKLFHRETGNPLFPNDPVCEAQALRALTDQHWAPHLVAQFDTEFGVCLAYSHIDGVCWKSGSRAVGRLMKQLHGLPVPVGLRHVSTEPAALRTQCLGLLEQSTSALDCLPELPSLIQVETMPPVFLHGDIVAGNLIQSALGLNLIDWQCPALGDPCHDIAIFLSPAMMQLYRGAALSQQEVQAFFDGYGAPQVQERYEALAPWFHYRMAAYCIWKSQQGSGDYAQAMQLEIAALQASMSVQKMS